MRTASSTCPLVPIALLVILLGAGPADAREELPALEGKCCNDHAGIISKKDESAIRALCEKAEKGGVQMMVVTLASLDGLGARAMRLDAVVDQLFDDWDIEYDAANDAILLFVARKERQIRIRMGEGYGEQANRKAQNVMRSTVGPALRRRASAGIRQGFDRLYREVAKPRIQEKKRKADEDQRKRGIVNFE
jgi:uncharacterized protein